MGRELEYWEQVERSLAKRFRKDIWTPFMTAIRQYEMIQAGDRIAVCISGGKDSMLLAVLLRMLSRFTTIPYELEYLVMDPGYNPANREKIERNAEKLNLPVRIIESDIFEVANGTERNPCYLCARMRRGHLYAYARDLGCNKIALGHHFSDVIETTVMAMFYGGQLQGMMPKLHSTNFPGMELIRPLYCVHEEDIISWKQYNGLDFLQCACRFTEQAHLSGDGVGESKRQEVKLLLRELRKTNPNVEANIFHALHSVSLDTFPGWKTRGTLHSFLEDYDQRGAAPEDGT